MDFASCSALVTGGAGGVWAIPRRDQGFAGDALTDEVLAKIGADLAKVAVK
jgi:hypothetical protein